MCKLEDMGLNFTALDKKPLETIRAFVALAMNGDIAKAGKELEEHLIAGYDVEDIMKEISRAVTESGFFRALGKRTAAGNGTSAQKT